MLKLSHNLLSWHLGQNERGRGGTFITHSFIQSHAQQFLGLLGPQQEEADLVPPLPEITVEERVLDPQKAIRVGLRAEQGVTGVWLE